ncbi:pantothenate kinase [Martiniozyma asiatica (nom. inval.)]|nr:pantothenate kinase [Martiniozyma asiatica]
MINLRSNSESEESILSVSTTNSDADGSTRSSRQNSIYLHGRCSNQKPLNVSDAFIVIDEKEYHHVPETKDISLPRHPVEDINELSIDIGGSLAKLVYFTNDSSDKGVRLNFFKLETDRIDEFIEFIKDIINKHYNHSKKPTIIATGGGSMKYFEKLSSELECTIQKEDEMQCLIIGLDFFITEIPNEIFYYQESNHSYVEIDKLEDLNIYPYLLVNIGSGVSMVEVTGPGPNNFERVGGSSLGGGTLWGLLSILTDAKDFDEMLEMASSGDNENVDLLVGDIYGIGYDKIGLKSNHIASSMGKVFKKVFDEPHDRTTNIKAQPSTTTITDIRIPDPYSKLDSKTHSNSLEPLEASVSASASASASASTSASKSTTTNPASVSTSASTSASTTTTPASKSKPPFLPREERVSLFAQEDIARSLLYAVSNNIGQIAYLQAQRYNLKKIYFAGSYIRNHPQTIRTLSYAINFWSKGEKKAYFLKHESYLGSLGGILMRRK